MSTPTEDWCVREAILKAMARKLKCWNGLYDRPKRRLSPKRVPLKTVERLLQLYREKYFDFKVRHFHNSPFRNPHGDLRRALSPSKTGLPRKWRRDPRIRWDINHVSAANRLQVIVAL
jgi:hypothetical protein